MAATLVLATEVRTCTCRTPWTDHEAFRWTPPADGREHVVIELHDMEEDV